MELKFTEIINRNRQFEKELVGNKYRIAIISNVSISQLKDVLEYMLRHDGINAEVTIGDYDSVVSDSHRFKEFDAVILFWELCNIIDDFQYKASILSTEEINAMVQKVELELDLVLSNLKNVPLVIFNYFTSMLFEMQPLKKNVLNKTTSTLNKLLEKKIGGNNIIVNIDSVLCDVGKSKATNYRNYQSSKSLYTIEFLKAYCESIKPSFLAVHGRVKKVLVLDCDNTLWHGILSEDGEDGIEMSGLTMKGKVFREVQYLLRGIRKSGIVLAVCSKNNASDVENVFVNHKDMILRLDDITAMKINWNDKASNLRDLGIELNVGLDSMVFLDDSSFEIGFIQKELPQVKCIQVPENLSEYPLLISKLSNEFFRLSASEEDSNKTKMYKDEQKRKEIKAQHTSTDDYLRSLGIVLSILTGKDIPIARAAQLTQKTNQFNLTTKRYTENDIIKMVENPLIILAAFSLADNYGEYGITGLCIVNIEAGPNPVAEIDTFLMSCRVLGRNIETAFLNWVVLYVKIKNISSIKSQFIETSKNQQVKEFYEKHGFNKIEDLIHTVRYEIELQDYQNQKTDHVLIKTSKSGNV